MPASCTRGSRGATASPAGWPRPRSTSTRSSTELRTSGRDQLLDLPGRQGGSRARRRRRHAVSGRARCAAAGEPAHRVGAAVRRLHRRPGAGRARSPSPSRSACALPTAPSPTRTSPRCAMPRWPQRPPPPARRCAPDARAYLGGRLLACATPRWTQASSCCSVCTPSASTRSHPRASRPRITIGSTCSPSSSDSVSSGGTLTSRPPWPLAATDMLPSTRNARPPNMVFSTMPDSPPRSSRMRAARSSS